MSITMDQTVREIAIANPGSVHAFEALGIDYCCGGQRSLRDACQHANVPLDEVLRLLSTLDEKSSGGNGDWHNSSVRELASHIVGRHHEYVRRESPRLISLLAKVVDRHGASHPELKSIQELFGAMADELSIHMMKEENVLFPYLIRMEAALEEGREAPPAMFGSVEVPISRMLADHEDAGALATQIRNLSQNFRPPDEACTAYCALYKGLEEFERDLHQHVHLENNILFPRALDMERREGSYARK